MLVAVSIHNTLRAISDSTKLWSYDMIMVWCLSQEIESWSSSSGRGSIPLMKWSLFLNLRAIVMELDKKMIVVGRKQWWNKYHSWMLIGVHEVRVKGISLISLVANRWWRTAIDASCRARNWHGGRRKETDQKQEGSKKIKGEKQGGEGELNKCSNEGLITGWWYHVKAQIKHMKNMQNAEEKMNFNGEERL